MRSTLAVALLAVAVAAVIPQPAFAGTVRMEGSEIHWSLPETSRGLRTVVLGFSKALDGEPAHFDLRPAATSALAPCGPGDSSADSACPAAGVTRIVVTLARTRDKFLTSGGPVRDECRVSLSNVPLTIDGGGGYDSLSAGRLGDVVIGGAERQEIEGHQGDDRLRGRGGPDSIDGGPGDDVLDGGSGPDSLAADEGSGLECGTGGLDGAKGDDVVRGGTGSDTLDGGRGNDRVLGGAGNDRVIDFGGSDVVELGRGNDRIDARDGRRDVIRCGPGRDRVGSADRRDRLIGCERRPRR